MSKHKKWNWQQSDWPDFTYDFTKLEALEDGFLHASGIFSGAIRHVGEDDKQQLTIDLISSEAMKTSEIEGELLNHDSLQSSVRRNFGLQTDNRKVPPAERGIAEMMVDLYRHFNAPLTHEKLYHWHTLLMSGRNDLKDIGCYRTDTEPMQIISGPVHAPKVHFEAPPSSTLKKEMKHFIQWFNDSAPDGKHPLPPLTRAGITHLYFESIHPFDDGNGRLGRALSEMALSQTLDTPTLIALSHTIQANRKDYYAMLEQSSHSLTITDWLTYFAETILNAQAHTQRMIDFIIAKSKFFDYFRAQLNERQEKALLRLFRAGPNGFEGGLSAENYRNITSTTRPTATRDLQDLVEIKALTRSGERKGTRYWLKLLKQ